MSEPTSNPDVGPGHLQVDRAPSNAGRGSELGNWDSEFEDV